MAMMMTEVVDAAHDDDNDEDDSDCGKLDEMTMLMEDGDAAARWRCVRWWRW